MKYTLQDRLLRRELGDITKYATTKGLYGDREWIGDLDIVDELGGHTGCVNALSWSTSGRLLASGSDDEHLNIHTYQRDSESNPFTLSTTVATGHTANIFSVKFMPHSNDRTLVTAAGDAEVRVFDIEYSGSAPESTSNPNMTSSMRGSRFHNTYKGVRYLTDGNTNARVYRSHSDRVKRIVTESSPNLFLTCSEDGEVRQFDLRLPSSAYPLPRGGRGFLSHRTDHDNSNVPPPLISYKKYNLDLNTISCSASQPHYIALGGAHLHCFLHDRRMLGRDVGQERGTPGSASPAYSMSSTENELMGQATRCVRKFAPEGKKRMRRTDNGHITACKISDANPNEMIASWSGDHIYSFDLIRSPDAADHKPLNSRGMVVGNGKGKARDYGDRKRKRTKASSGSHDAGRRSSKPRHQAGTFQETGDMALRVRYENGQSEEIAMKDVASDAPNQGLQTGRDMALTGSQKRSLLIANSLSNIRKMIFSLHESSSASTDEEVDITSHSRSFTAALGQAAACLPEMNDISKTWRYPVDPLPEDVVFQSTLRGNRDTARRFVQAAGTLARVLGGRLQTAGSSASPALELFQEIGSNPSEGSPQSVWEIFRYDFLKAILLWLEGGRSALLEGFRRSSTKHRRGPRNPVPEDATEDAIDEKIISYLLRVAVKTDSPIPNVDASRFERDETRQIFGSESAAVIAFANAIKSSPGNQSLALDPTSDSHQSSSSNVVQDRLAICSFWAFKVGRGLLLNAAEGLDFQAVDTAFGGLGQNQSNEDRNQEEIDPNEDEDTEIVQEVALITTSSTSSSTRRAQPPVPETNETTDARNHDAAQATDADVDFEDAGSDADVVLMDDFHDVVTERMADGDQDDESHPLFEESGDEDADSQAGDDNDDDDDDDADATATDRSFMFRSASDRGKLRERVEQDVPCYPHTRQYRGHCNVKTVKDANFFGLQDDYVVSGSDGGHIFIWDRRTSELVNILEGDGEVVNVIQGHPCEPVMAVSGIDYTIKIFSPDRYAQDNAEKGTNISSNGSNASPGDSLFSMGTRRNFSEEQPTRNDNQGLTSRKRMHQSYQILAQNDAQRQGGMRDAFITRGMLAQLAARLRARQGGGGGVGGGAGGGGGVMVGEDGETVLIDDNCTIM